MGVGARLHILVLASHVWLLVKMSVVVSMSVKQSCSFEESCSSNVGISYSRVLVMFACKVVCMSSSLAWVLGCGWSSTAICCSPSANCIKSSRCVDGWMAGSKGGVGPKVTGINLATQPSDS